MLTRLTIPEFCYWLQGAIEIGGLNSIDMEQAKLIHKRLSLVKDVNYFTISVKAILENYPLDAGFRAIAEELQHMFKHDIDPSYEGDQDFYHAVHEGKGVPKNEK